MSRTSDEKKTGEIRRAHARLKRQLVRTGFLWVGTVLRRYHQCRKPSCRCSKGGRFRHGPYYVWTRKIGGKTVTRMLSEEEGKLYTEWIRNRRDLARTIKKIHRLSEQLAPILLRKNAKT